MSPEQITARLQTLRDRTGNAVCLKSEQWRYFYPDDNGPQTWEVWIAAHGKHYPGATADLALSAAEDACLFATMGDGA